MRESRRVFLGLAFGAAATVGAPAFAQQNPQAPSPTIPPTIPSLPPLHTRDREYLKENQARIKKDIARLSQLVDELQQGLDDSDTREVLSLDVIHKTEEIEKLAKQIRDLVRA
jgi:hypothetical protein